MREGGPLPTPPDRTSGRAGRAGNRRERLAPI